MAGVSIINEENELDAVITEGLQEYYDKVNRLAAERPKTELDLIKEDLDNLGRQYHKTHTSFSGADLLCTIQIPNQAPIIFGELFQISYSTYREKMPVRALGRVTPKGFTRGFRTITGIIAFSVFDESIVRKAMHKISSQGYNILMDEMPLFDITISGANEYGARSKLSIIGITTVTEGMAMSIDDLSTANVYEFHAIDIRPLESLGRYEDPLGLAAGGK